MKAWIEERARLLRRAETLEAIANDALCPERAVESRRLAFEERRKVRALELAGPHSPENREAALRRGWDALLADERRSR